LYVDPDAGCGQHVDQRVDAEERELPPHEVANPRLRNSEQRSGFPLPQASPLNDLAQRVDQLGAQPEMLVTHSVVPKAGMDII
jgi:hypothetical protein